eukprot:scaffold74679_cov31-Attheya_sp.AAC.2
MIPLPSRLQYCSLRRTYCQIISFTFILAQGGRHARKALVASWVVTLSTKTRLAPPPCPHNNILDWVA